MFDPKRLRGAKCGERTGGRRCRDQNRDARKIGARFDRTIGAEIKKGESVLVVEAMKMQNEMKSPKDGIVKEIRFEEGATVNAGDILAIIE